MEVGRLAARQWGVVSRAQLQALGVSRGAIEHWLSVGRLQLLYRGVYAVGHALLRAEGHRLAAVLACGPGAVPGLSDEVCVVVVIDPVLAAGPAATGAPEGRASWPARRAAREGTTHHHDQYAVQAAPGHWRRAA